MHGPLEIEEDRLSFFLLEPFQYDANNISIIQVTKNANDEDDASFIVFRDGNKTLSPRGNNFEVSKIFVSKCGRHAIVSCLDCEHFYVDCLNSGGKGS
jgi:hypothetical protein